MRKILISILCVFVGFSAFCAGENIPTSKSYVDSAVAQKQDKIPANNGATQILMNTGTPGNVGTKDIYDSTGAYGTQTESLVTAEQFNTAVQNAIDSEFECVGWNPNDSNDCWFVQIRSAVERSMTQSGYTRLEYLESSGTQYIDTGIMSGINIQVQAKFGKISDTFTRYGIIVGANQNYQALVSRTTPNTYYSSLKDSYTGYAMIPVTADVFEFTFNTPEHKVIVNDSIYNLPIIDDFVSDKIGLFNWIRYGGTQYAVKGRLYYVTIKNNATNTTLADFIPARRNSDGELGMYDTISNTFFTNAGDGEFIAGPDANNIYLPSGN